MTFQRGLNVRMERKSGDWMSIWDDRILEFIRSEGHASPKDLMETGGIHVTKATISRRMRRLAEYGFLTHLGNGIYVMTDDGEAYLNGDLDAQKISPEDQPGNQSNRSASA
jgi:predicted transcriptional regulator